MDVGELAILVVGPAECPFVDEADPFIQAPGTLVEVVDVEPDSFEPKLAKAEVENSPDRVGAITLAGVARVADGDAETRRPVREVEVVEVDRPDGPVVVDATDDEMPRVAALSLEQCVEPALFEGQAQRCPGREEACGPSVAQPADEQRQIVTFGRTEVRQLATQKRFRPVGSPRHQAAIVTSRPSSIGLNASSRNGDGATGS
jgi:hypothetical protein